MPEPSYGTFLLQTLLVLAVVCAVAWLILRFGVRRLYSGGGHGPLRVVARLPLEPRRTLYIVDAAGKIFFVGTSEGGPVTLLAELDPAVVEAALAAARSEPRAGLLDILRRK
ncbi:MAG TPA: flagellar biosynthetic protein FliO [Haliangiales bacterium]|nr:flagellar biosynthetic protein FliO [Haliangiales bacterium]